MKEIEGIDAAIFPNPLENPAFWSSHRKISASNAANELNMMGFLIISASNAAILKANF
ncbi:hypothetical protein NYE76_10580 [Paenibacillus sp. FSL M7-0831]|uniref:hypothetical protein n=1 Tax=Paenibacillus macerans TaxID=44252 RepID=UPI0012D97407|nr:hypothetical protein [Paenibacillus macerans]MBS5914151.1 hypothetical protein [Paenibacillus macerans]